MSLWEGIRAAGAIAHPFMHNNMSHLRGLLERHGSGVIVIDSVYSTIGTIAPLRDIEMAQAWSLRSSLMNRIHWALMERMVLA